MRFYVKEMKEKDKDLSSFIPTIPSQQYHIGSLVHMNDESTNALLFFAYWVKETKAPAMF